MTDKRIANSARLGAARVLLTEMTREGTVSFVVNDRDAAFSRQGLGITLTPENVVAALDGLVPGLSVTYEKPIEVPQGLGAVIKFRQTYYVRGVDNYWHYAALPESSVTDAWIEGRLREGAEILSEGIIP